MSRLVGVIPAAGRGTRAYPYTREIPKCMLEIDGRPNIERVIGIMRDQMGIQQVVVVVGHLGDVLRAWLGDGSRFGVKLTYVQNGAIDKGLSHSILLARPYVDEHFCVMLSDECYIDSNHHELATSDYSRALATCAVMPARDPDQVRRNYAVFMTDERVRDIVEKPRDPAGGLLGVGTFIFHRDIFDHLEAALESRTGEPRDPVSVMGRLCRKGAAIHAFPMRGSYVNVNDRDELNLANNLARTRDFAQRSLALALVMRGSPDEALRSLDEFRALQRFHQIVLVVPPGTELPEEQLAGAHCVTARSCEYGDMLRTGFDALQGDILFAAYADGSFSARDVPKFLEYLKEADLVVGTRTTRQLVHQGTNMRGVVRLGHLWLAKFLELVWWGYEPSFTDVGCTYRALWSSTYRLIRPRVSTSGPGYSVELLIETLKSRRRVVEIPVNFRLKRKRKEPDQNLRTVVSIIRMIVIERLRLAAGHYVPSLRLQVQRVQPPVR